MCSEDATPNSEGSRAGVGHDGQVLARVRGVGRTYRIWRSPASCLEAHLLARAAAIFPKRSRIGARLAGRSQSRFTAVPALSGVSFDLQRGEVVGVIGRNGSGKSTLLQILAGALPPTEGEVEINGRVSALLELGVGFNPDFTGRENVFMSAAVQGMSRKDVESRFDRVAGFADIGSFMDSPVRTYSSGMAVRLAFAVQVLFEPDILLIDEALAVGDIFFQQKCHRHLQAQLKRGVGVLLVTHDVDVVLRLCRRAILLDAGKVVMMGPSEQVVRRFFMELNREQGGEGESPRPGGFADAPTPPVGGLPSMVWPAARGVDVADAQQVTNGGARCTRILVCDTDDRPRSVFEQGSTARFYYEVELLRDMNTPSAGIAINDRVAMLVHAKHLLQYRVERPAVLLAGTRLCYRQDVVLRLSPGEYTYHVGVISLPRDLHEQERITEAELFQRHSRLVETHNLGRLSVVGRTQYRGLQPTHWGLADLDGEIRWGVLSGSGGEGVGS